MDNLKTLLRHSLLLGLITIIAVSFFPTTQPVHAQDGDGQTPTALCEAAVENIAEPETQTYAGAEQVLEDGVDYQAIFCTESGAIYVDLLEKFAPITVNNFVFLAQNDYYNYTTFHRVIENFMVQGGDPTGAGSGGPGYQFGDEFLSYVTFETPGWLAMANSGPGTNGSQFFITRAPTIHLNGLHTIFGQVREGQDVVDNMRNRDPQNPDDASAPGPTLFTVLVVTAEDNVQSDYVEPAPYTIEDVNNSLAQVPSEGFTVDEDASGMDTREFEAYGEIPSASVFLATTDCPAEPDLFAVGLRVIDWETSEVATEVMSDSEFVATELAGAFPEVPTAALEGYVVSNNLTYCDMPSAQHRYIWGRGQYVLIMDFVIGDELIPADQLPLVVSNLAGYFEGFVGNAIFISINQ